jgi:hypothetical protein
MNVLWEISDFVRKVRREMRFGELSRAPLRLLRFEVLGDRAECEWVMRPSDPWDADLGPEVGERNQTMQALQDAMLVRELLLSSLSGIHTAKFRVYRQSLDESCELIIAGTIARDDDVPQRVSSLVMRAKLCGLRFWLDNGVLATLQSEECSVSA